MKPEKNCHPRLIYILLLPLLILFSCTRREPVSLKSLLMDISDRESLTIFPEPGYKLKQFSSYDRASVSPSEPGWFANADYTNFLSVDEKNGRKEYVLFDADGPGAIVRWWMTFAGKGSYEGTVRVYLDNAEEPAICDSILRVLSGNALASEPLSSAVSPLTGKYQRGHNLYLPLPYSKHCRITYECNAITINEKTKSPSIYYNICYREYERGTTVVTFSKDELENSKKLLEDVSRKLLEPSGHKDGESEYRTAGAKPGHGEMIQLEINKRNYAINELGLKLKSGNYPQALRSLVLSVEFDGNRTVWVPAGEFFGTGYKRTISKTWFSMVDTGGIMKAWWLMPFKNYALVRLINYGREPVEATLQVGMVPYRWQSRSMYFGASWHEYHNILAAGASSTGGTGRHSDLNFVDIKGKGVYAGDAITIFNTVNAWFGEGDEKIYVDGEDFPSSIGTGTEDYYGYAWCRPEIFSHPFIAQPSGSGNFDPGQTINMRYRSLDAIPFTSSISSNIELWHWVSTVMNYAMTTYYYILPGAAVNTAEAPLAVINPVPLERSDIILPEPDQDGLIEGEYLDVEKCTGGETETQTIRPVGWSNNSQLWWKNGKPGDTLMLRFTVGQPGYYEIKTALTCAVDYAFISMRFNDSAPVTFDGYVPEGIRIKNLVLSKQWLKKGDNYLILSIKGSDKKAKPGFMAGIDFISLKKE